MRVARTHWRISRIGISSSVVCIFLHALRFGRTSSISLFCSALDIFARGSACAPGRLTAGCRPAGISTCRSVERAPRRCGGAIDITDPEDARLALYRLPEKRNPVEYNRQVDALTTRAIHEAALEMPSACNTDVHYSWDCLRRLQQAREAGKEITVSSVLVPAGTPEDLISLARIVSPDIYSVDRALMGQFSTEGSRNNFCHFVTAFPFSRPLKALRPPFLVLDDLESSHTIGQIIRTAYHFGVDSIVASGSTWKNLDGRACRVAMGWAYHMDFHFTDSVIGALQDLQAQGVRVYGAESSSSQGKPAAPHEPRGEGSWALVIGHEEKGLSREVAELCQTCMHVPQHREGSMNVAHSAAICLYEVAGLCPAPDIPGLTGSNDT